MEATTLFSRADYMDKKCSHNDYYSQFVTRSMKQVILNKYSKYELKEKYLADEHLNNIPLKWWDNLSELFKQEIAQTNKQLNGQSTWCLSDGVCAFKAAARQIIESD